MSRQKSSTLVAAFRNVVQTVVVAILLAVPAVADIVTNGDVVPSDPNTWTSSGWGCIGFEGNGELSITDGSVISTAAGYLGYDSHAAGTVAVSGADSTWYSGEDLYVGFRGSGELSIADGGGVSNSRYSYIGHESNSTGTATVSGADSTWDSGDLLCVGWQGSGEMSISDGGTVSDWMGAIAHESGSTGTVIVSGAGSTWNNTTLNVGGLGNGELRIVDGGAVNSSSDTGESTGSDIGREPGSTGTVIVSGAGSTWNSGEWLDVGGLGSGELNIADGGAVNGGVSVIGRQLGSTGTVTVSGADSTWNNDGGFCVGRWGRGELNITDGATVSGSVGNIGSRGGSTGTVIVSGAGSTWDSSDTLCVGNEGSGELSIADGGTVSVTGTTRIARSPSSSGSIHFANGTLTTSFLHAVSNQLTGTGTINTNGLIADGVDLIFDATHGRRQSFVLNDQAAQNITINLDQDASSLLGAGYVGSGTLTIRDAVTIESSDGYIGYRSGSTGTVTVSGAGSTWNANGLYVGWEGHGEMTITDGGAVNNSYARVVSGSDSTSTVTVSGADSMWSVDTLRVGWPRRGEMTVTDRGLVSVGKTLKIGPTIHDNGAINMSTGGMLAISGHADDSLSDFLGLISGADEIRYWDDVADDWSHITNATPGVDYILRHFDSGDLAGYTMLTVGMKPGDANLDGETDLVDFNIWNANKFTTDTGWTSGDFNGDGMTDLSDFNIWNANKFTSTTGGAAPVPTEVPEPGTLGLLIVAMAIGLASWRWRRGSA